MRLNHCYNLVATHNIVKVILRSNFPVRFFAFQLAGKERREISSFAFSAKVLMRWHSIQTRDLLSCVNFQFTLVTNLKQT